MRTVLRRFLATGACLLLLVGVASAQEVVVGPMMASGGAGQDVDFNIVYQGPADINGVSFDIIYQADAMAAFSPIFESGSPSHIACSTASDLPADVKTSAVLLPGHGRIAFTVIGLNFNTGPVPFGRSGILGTCQFVIAPDAGGTIPLLCDRTTRATASDVNGREVTIACVDGALTVEGGGSAGGRGRGAAAGAIGEPPVVDTGSGGAAAPVNEPVRPSQQAARPASGPLAQAGQAGQAPTVPAAAPTEAMATATAAAHATPSLPPRTAPVPEAAATQGAAAASPPVQQPTATTAPPPRPSSTKQAAAPAQPTPAEKSGCAIAAPTHERGYWLFAPAVALLVFRARRVRFRAGAILKKRVNSPR